MELSGPVAFHRRQPDPDRNDLRGWRPGPTTGLAEIPFPTCSPAPASPGRISRSCRNALMVCARVCRQRRPWRTRVSSRTQRDDAGDDLQPPGVDQAALAWVCPAARHRCIDGIKADEQRILRYATVSPSVVTRWNKYVRVSKRRARGQAALNGGPSRQVLEMRLRRPRPTQRRATRRGAR